LTKEQNRIYNLTKKHTTQRSEHTCKPIHDKTRARR